MSYILSIIINDPDISDRDRKGVILAGIFAGLIMLGFVWGGAIIFYHAVWPKEAFVEITDQNLNWRDAAGFGTVDFSVSLASIKAVRIGRESDNDFLELNSGAAIGLPYVIIPDMQEFKEALAHAAPHIFVEKK